MPIIFAGTPAFARASLTALIEAGHVPQLVLTQPDRPAGRGRTLRASDVKLTALEYGIEVYQPRTLRSQTVQERLRKIEPDLLVVAAYGLLLPADVLNIPRVACVNVHASLLPRWRGASPVQAAILAGDEVTGISLMKMDEGLDTGPVYLRRELPIRAGETAGELQGRLAVLGGELLAGNISCIGSGKLKAEPQAGEAPSYAPRISKSDALIDWSASAIGIARSVRAYNPWPVSYTEFEGRLLKCWRAAPLPAETDATPGTILEADTNGVVVACGEGALRMDEIQLAGKRRIRAGEFANQTDLAGKRLGG